jgi:hypothetical protein
LYLTSILILILNTYRIARSCTIQSLANHLFTTMSLPGFIQPILLARNINNFYIIQYRSGGKF